MEIASFLISIVALIVSLLALPTVVQMIWGAPKLVFASQDFHNDEGHVLRLTIDNCLMKAWLRRLGVVRTPAEILGSLNIVERGSSRLIHENLPLNFVTQKESGLQVTIFSGSLPAFTNLVAFLSAENKAYIYVDDKSGLPISPGNYEFQISIITMEQTVYFRRQYVKIGCTRSETFLIGAPEVFTPVV